MWNKIFSKVNELRRNHFNLSIPKINLLKKITREIKYLLIIFTLTFFVIQPFVIASYEVPTCSMEPTIMTNTKYIALPSAYGGFIRYTNIKLPGFKKLHRGDIVMFRFPKDKSIDYVKRAIGLPGDTVEIKEKTVYINGLPLHEPYTYFSNGKDYERAHYGPNTIPQGHIFVLGDNRDKSWDSRYWGFVPLENVFGTPLFSFWSYDKKHKQIRSREILKILK